MVGDKPFLVRPVTEEDAAGIVEVLNPMIEAGIYTMMDTPLSVGDQIEFMRDLPEYGVYQVAVSEDSQTIVGLQDVLPKSISESAFPHVGEISTFVALDSHRNGIGHALCESTFQKAKALGYRKLSATIRADNLQAIAFYESEGFRIVNEEYNAILAEKLLG